MQLHENASTQVKNTFKTLEQRFREVHGNRHDYSKSVFTKMSDKLQIFCNVCKESFPQTPSNHVAGRGCPKCGKKLGTIKKSKLAENFIKKDN